MGIAENKLYWDASLKNITESYSGEKS